jgi:hypothetical protein
MKTFVTALVLAAFALPFAACSDTQHVESTKTHWDGSTTHQDTTIRTAPDGSTSVDKTRTTTR